MQSARFTLSSFRAGGATHHFRMYRNLGQLQYHGRWKSSATLEHYLHEAYSALVMSQLPEVSKQLVEAARVFVPLLAQPPVPTAAQLFARGHSGDFERF